MEALSVSQLNEYVRRVLASDPMLHGLRLRGEISNFKRHTAGHLYFTLKDEQARIACVMFRSAAASLRIVPRDGMRVEMTGSVSLYAAAGQYQFYAETMRDDGVGILYERFEQLKAALLREGLFDPALKKDLPLLPRCVGVVTSPTGAVIHDIQQVTARRNPGVQILLAPSSVQGDGAAEEIAAAIARLDAMEEVDVIIVGRGGGSLEELWAFNEEVVARAIFAAHTPIISAVGHETDVTIADFTADRRAATPSAAAELAVPNRPDLQAVLDGLRRRAEEAMTGRVGRTRQTLAALAARLAAQHPGKVLDRRREQTRMLYLRLSAAARARHALLRQQAEGLRGRLEALSPRGVLARGFALVTDEKGGILTRAAQAREGMRLRVSLQDGTFGAAVTEEAHLYGGEEKT